ncbi:PKD domain-containing protein [Tamlana flava]|uniref:PKD domain-containing protein n=1 Tax=Tamlana flava TaxID=3158572 RepID=UPI00351AFD55
MKKNLLSVLTLTLVLLVFVSCDNENNDYPPFGPTAIISSTPDANNGLMITFNARVTNAESILWDFGDGNTSSDANVTYTYGAGGTYIVTLTVTGVDGTTPVVKTKTINAFNFQSITIINGDFELPVTGNQIRSWADPSIPGWTSDDPRTDDQDSGVQNGNGGRTGYLYSKSPYNPYQTTSHAIGVEGETYAVSCVFGDAWANENGTVILYFLEDDGVTRTPLGSATFPQDGYITVRQLTVQATAASVGKFIGIEFDNPDTHDSWLGIDNVVLEYSI